MKTLMLFISFLAYIFAIMCLEENFIDMGVFLFCVSGAMALGIAIHDMARGELFEKN